MQAVSSQDAGLRVTLSRIWDDARLGLEVGDWVELVDDDWAPVGSPPPLLRVEAVTLASREVILSDPGEGRMPQADRHPLLRRWDQQPDDDDGATAAEGIPVADADGSWFELEDGVQIHFESAEAVYERGDYWLIPARTETGGVLWPQSADPDRPGPHALAPTGPARFLTPLALVDATGATTDLRVRFGQVPRFPVPEQGPPQTLDGATMVTVAPAVTEVAQAPVIPQPSAAFELLSVSSFEANTLYPVGDGGTAGRAHGSEIRLDHTGVSRHHAKFAITDGHLTVTDLGSSNGTAINDRVLAPHLPAPVEPGDIVQLGSPEVQLRVQEA